MSDVKYYRDLLAQERRIEAFRRAIAAVVQPGDRVLDVGTGVGTFAFFAADAGAAEVYAIESEPVIHVARAVARLNGYADRVRFVRGRVPEVRLPERVDVVIFEDFPARLLSGSVVRLLRAMHHAYAAPGARTVPAGAEFFLAPVSSEALWAEIAPFGPSDTAYGIDWSPSRVYVANAPRKSAVAPTSLLAAPQSVCRVRFDAPFEASEVRGHATWRVESAAPVHGLAYWFDLDLGGGERLSNGPGAEPGSWGHLYLPVDPPVQVHAGEAMHAEVSAAPRADGAPGWLAWEVVTAGARVRGHEFSAAPASLRDLAAASPDGVPSLADRGVTELKVLGLTDGTRSIRDIAREIAAERPDLTQADAERLVVGVLQDKIEISGGLAAQRGEP
ncbi:MAG: class I SAM-dependent methyltransferase [Gemmatimonadota bacterium]|nr:MAG: class I SAM-dependent methyltransferase [Gemmatimonadota bacterium]